MLARQLAGECTAEESAELEQLLRQHPDESFSVEAIQSYWPATDNVNRAETEKSYKDLLTKMSRHGIADAGDNANEIPPRSSRQRFGRKALLLSCLGILCLVAMAWFFNHKSQPVLSERIVENKISTRYGSKSQLTLPDGSRVYLNAGSTLTYDKDFGNKVRSVSLSGEAFFDIAHNKQKPFIIHTTEMDIRVLGTAFNVKSYPEEGKTEASLVRGSIEVTVRGRSEKIILKPNEKLVVNRGGREVSGADRTDVNRIEQPILTLGHMTLMPVDSSVVETSWVNNKLVFRGERFDELAVKMERWYGVSIRFNGEQIRARRFTGVFEKENISQALQALQMTTAFGYAIDKDVVIISD